jgi:hypothetical protein
MKKFISLYDSADFTTLPVFSLPDTKCSMTFKCGQREMVLSQALSVRQVRLLIPRFSLCSFGRLHNLPAGEGVMSDFINVSLSINHRHFKFPLLPIFRLSEKILAYRSPRKIPTSIGSETTPVCNIHMRIHPIQFLQRGPVPLMAKTNASHLWNTSRITLLYLT